MRPRKNKVSMHYSALRQGGGGGGCTRDARADTTKVPEHKLANKEPRSSSAALYSYPTHFHTPQIPIQISAFRTNKILN